MPDPTPDTEVSPPSETTEQPSKEEPTETVESLKEKLAATEKEKSEALEEANRWKGRVKEENPKKKKEETPDDYADWRIDNKERIALVKEQYEKELAELQEAGIKPTNAVREKALRLAESTVGVKKADPSEPLPSPTVERGGQKEIKLTETDVAMGVKPETKKKYAHLENQW